MIRPHFDTLLGETIDIRDIYSSLLDIIQIPFDRSISYQIYIWKPDSTPIKSLPCGTLNFVEQNITLSLD